MLSIYIPFVSTGFNPNACIGDSIYEWVVNTTSKTLTRIYKETYVRTNTIDIPAANCTHITMGTNQNINYIFTSSGASTGNIYRINSIGDNPINTLKIIQLTKTDPNKNVCCSAIAYKNGYLWVVPSAVSGITGTIIRLNIFSDLTKTSYTYTDGSTQQEVTVCNILGFNSATVSTMYIF